MPKEFLLSVTKKDLVVQTFRASGPGGQNVNKIESAVRIIHPDSGAVGESREHRTQWQNKKAALKRLTEHKKFKIWLNKMAYELKYKKTIDQIVDEQMQDKNLKLEVRDENGKWSVVEGIDE